MKKSSNHKKTGSAFLHIPRTRVQSSKLSRSKATNHKIFSASRHIILIVIIMAMLMVVLAILSRAFLTPERIVKQKIEAITTDYYENYFYPQFTAVAEMQNPNILAEKMKRYETPGFSTITLRQLLLFDNQRYATAADILTAYCDENKTYMQIFPEPPFEKTNYRVEYHYSCDF